MRYNLVEVSQNRKVGPLPIVQAPRKTCWQGCPFKDFCYGEAWPCGLQWDKVEERGEPLAVVCQELHGMKASRWRYGDVGDLPGANGNISKIGMHALVKANAGRWGWAYTHKPLTKKTAQARRNRELIAWANSQGFAVNLSAEGWKRADELANLRIGPVFTVLPHTLIDDRWKRSMTPEGRLIIRCPAERGKLTCQTCGGSWGPLCARIDRGFIIGVTTHGCQKNRVAGVVAEIEMFGQRMLL